MLFPRTRLRQPFAFLLVSALLLGSCSVNPATGKQQLNFFGEESEIELGREADAEIVATVGLYDDPELQEYVADLGRTIASKSERPGLAWSFKVLDDPAVNAFALPGGFVYVTRGLISHLGSEAELMGVLGHEAGHVTARHGVNQMSKQILAAVGLGVASVLLDPEDQWAAFAGELGLGLFFLKHSRDDERQADDLGLRYALATGYDPREVPKVFEVLEGVAKVEGVGGLPSWLSTHPDPGARRQRLADEVAALNADFANATVNRDAYLAHLDGLVFGENPREGYFRQSLFLHPEMGFQVRFPDGWETENQKAAVAASDPKGKAMIQVTVSDEVTLEEAAEAFYADDEGLTEDDPALTQEKSWKKEIHGLPASWSQFQYEDGEDKLSGTVAFVEHDGQIFQLLALAQADAWDDQREALEDAIASFAELDDPKALAVKSNRIKLVHLKEDMTVARFHERYPSVVPIETVALINHVEPGGALAKGRTVKQVVEGE